jgi:hypothetical protein
MALINRAFFISFLEETVQKTHANFLLAEDVLMEPLPETAFDAIMLICKRACLVLFGDSAPQLKRKDDKNFVIVTKTPDFYAVYRDNDTIYKQKTQKMLRMYADVIQGIFRKCNPKPNVFIVESDGCAYVHMVFDEPCPTTAALL